MKNFIQQRWWILAACLLLILAAIVVLFVCMPFSPKTIEYVAGEYPEGVSFSEIGSGERLSEQEIYDAYDPNKDPAHPVLDTKVALYISNLGSKPGEPRPQDIGLEYPRPTTSPSPSPAKAESPEVTPFITLNPGIVMRPGMKPLPELNLPELNITNPKVESPRFTGESFKLMWQYSGGRKVTYTVSFSDDNGESFAVLAKDIPALAYTLKFPDEPADHCILRVSAMLEGREYITADTSAFKLVAAPEPVPEIIKNYVDSQVQYTDMPGLRISSLTGLPVWFKAESQAQGAAKLVWQLSKTPFFGTKEVFGTESGILASGELDADGGEFSIDLDALCEELTKTGTGHAAGTPFLAKRDIYAFYLRVVALDPSGACIGDPGRGLYFTYGIPEIIADMSSPVFANTPEIAVLVNLPYYSDYKWQRVTPGVLNRDVGSTPDMLLLSALDGSETGSAIIEKAVQVELQVATSPFSNAVTSDFTKPEGLVYSSLDTAPDIFESNDGFAYFTPWFHGVEYDEFALEKAELDALGGIYYYVRAVFYVPDRENPSVLRPHPSETMTIAYRVTSAKQNEVKKITVKSNIPYIQFLSYTPVKWQEPDYEEYFEVTRHIEAEEMNFSIRNTETGDFLIPYPLHIAQYGWTREQYQAKLDHMLPVGASFHHKKSEPGFWDEFFGLLNAIYSGVSNAYADAKTSVVSLIDYLPIGDTARSYLKSAATIAIDYGLASIGLPPSLPNIDQLAEGGMDYLLKVAVDEALQSAGVPADSAAAKEITEEVRGELAAGLTAELEKSVVAQQQNPFRADFLRIYTEKLYKPAYIEVLVANYSSEYSAAGSVGISFQKSFAVYNSQGVTLPSLKPGESYVIRLYLEDLRNQYVGYNQYFDQYYYGNSDLPFKMFVYGWFSLPDVKQVAKDQGIAPAPLPYITEFVYDHQGYQYEREFVPAQPIVEPDPAPNKQDFTN